MSSRSESAALAKRAARHIGGDPRGEYTWVIDLMVEFAECEIARERRRSRENEASRVAALAKADEAMIERMQRQRKEQGR